MNREMSNIPACNKFVRRHCKTRSLSVRLVFETRAKCQHFVARYQRSEGISTKLIIHISPAEPISLSASPSHLKTVKSGNVCLYGKFWQQSSKFSFLNEMTLVPVLSLRSTSVHRISTSRIAETAWENQCSILRLWETDKCLPLLLLLCMFLVFLTTCCNKSSLKPCDDRPFVSPLFRGRGPFFRGFPIRWTLPFAFAA